MPRLVITRGSGAGRDFAINGECVVGRAADADLSMDDIGASRRHCRVRAEGSGFVVEDLGSRNGTYVNGQRIQMSPLAEGDVIRIGTVEMIFRADAPVAAVPVPVAACPKVAVPPAIPRPAVVAARPPVVVQPPAPAKPAAAAAAPSDATAAKKAEPPKKKYNVGPYRRRQQ